MCFRFQCVCFRFQCVFFGFNVCAFGFNYFGYNGVGYIYVTYRLHIGYISVTYKGVGYVPRMLTSVTYIKVKSLRDFRVGFLFFSREFGFNVRFRFQTGT